MRFRKKFISINQAAPDALGALANIEDIPTYHEQYGSLHPSAAYIVSLSAVSKRILRVLNSLNKIGVADYNQPIELIGKADDHLIEETENMLRALIEHVDDCAGIIRSFFSTSDKKFFRKELKQYQKPVNNYRNHIANIANYLKHNQGRLCPIKFSWPHGVINGYFVLGPTKNNGLGPVDVIHKNTSTAFSYNRDIPFHVANIFCISSHLTATLHSINKKIPLNNTVESPHEWLKILEMVIKLPHNVFPDEVNLGFPLIRPWKTGIFVEYPESKTSCLPPPPVAAVGCTMPGDGVTKTFSIPYYNPS